METYVLAREIADNKRIPSGWDLVGPDNKDDFKSNFFRLEVEGLAIKQMETPVFDPNFKAPERARRTDSKLD